MSKKQDELLEQGRDVYEAGKEAMEHNFDAGLEDARFSILGDQWPLAAKQRRELEGRPCLTLNKTKPFIRQVVNDARQNKPAIKFHPADSAADVETAKILNGLVRNIEYASNAPAAYDTAVEHAVTMGFGYFTIGLDYTYDDSFDMDITINRVVDPFSIIPDPYSKTVDSSDWNDALELEWIKHSVFDREFGSKTEKVDWEDTRYTRLTTDWMQKDMVRIARWWNREEYTKKIVLISNGQDVQTFSEEDLSKEVNPDLAPGVTLKDVLIEQGYQPIKDRDAKCYKVHRRTMTGAEILEEEEWLGVYIPIVPVYGEEFYLEGRRYLRSLVHDAKDAQRNFNLWRSASTESVLKSPIAPWIGPEGFVVDPHKWATANREAHAYLEYKGDLNPPQQIFPPPPAAGALQEALNSADDMKAIIGKRKRAHPHVLVPPKP